MVASETDDAAPTATVEIPVEIEADWQTMRHELNTIQIKEKRINIKRK
jgi:hypothetical protein